MKLWSRSIRVYAFVASLAALLAGCGVQPPPTFQALQEYTDKQPRQGHVYLVRGLLGTFSVGMDHIRDELLSEGVSAVTFQHTAGNAAAKTIAEQSLDQNVRPVIIIGHSLGADEAVAIARRLHEAGHSVDLVITLDPVYAAPVPPNVHEAINIYRSAARFPLPLFRGRPLKSQPDFAGNLRNIDIKQMPALLEPGTNHFNIDTNQRVQRQIVQLVLERCPPIPSGEIAGSMLPAKATQNLSSEANP